MLSFIKKNTPKNFLSKDTFMIAKILGPSPMLYGIKKIHSYLFVRGGSQEDVCLSDEAFFELMTEEQPPRMTGSELQEWLDPIKKVRLTKDQKLLKSVIEQAKLSRAISEKDFQNLEEMYAFRRKYKNYLRIKRFVPLCMVAPFTGTELSKMAIAAALGSKSVCLTLPGLIGYSLPAFYFFHMSSFYVSDKLKPICQVCKYTIGAPFWIAGSLTDGLTSSAEENFFGEEVPIDIPGTGGTIPADLGDINKLRDLIADMKDLGKEFGKKTY